MTTALSSLLRGQSIRIEYQASQLQLRQSILGPALSSVLGLGFVGVQLALQQWNNWRFDWFYVFLIGTVVFQVVRKLYYYSHESSWVIDKLRGQVLAHNEERLRIPEIQQVVLREIGTKSRYNLVLESAEESVVLWHHLGQQDAQIASEAIAAFIDVPIATK